MVGVSPVLIFFMYALFYQKYMKQKSQIFAVQRYYKVFFVAAVIISLLLSNVAIAQVAVISDQNSSASINLGSQAGMFNWTVDGLNQLNQQWFWFGLGSASRRPYRFNGHFPRCYRRSSGERSAV